MLTEEVENLVISIRLLNKFFDRDSSKVAAWLTIPNPNLGETRPIDFYMRGRGHKVLSFIENALEENEL